MDDRKRKAEQKDANTEAVEPGEETRPGTAEAQPEPDAQAQPQPEAAQAEAEAKADAPEAAPEPSEADQLREQIAHLQGRLRTVSKAYTDLQNEMRSFRDRMDAQLKLSRERQAFDLVKTFFDPVMNLKRSITSHGDDMVVLLEGLQMIHHQFLSALEGLGLEKVPGEGADFDPNMHEALAVTPVTDPAQDGKILMVHADGYAVNGRVLQAAQVVIGKYEAPQGEA